MAKRATKTGRYVYCFPDSNFFFHFTYFNEIDWPALLGCDRACLVVTTPVLRELDKYKSDRNSGRRRDRSRSVLREFDAIIGSSHPGVPLEFRRSTEILFDLSAADMTAHMGQLEPDVEDDKILALVMAFQSTHPDGDVLLLTDDRAMRLKAKALGIACFVPPEEHRLVDEPTTAEQELARLREEVGRMRASAPVLSSGFNDPQGATDKLVVRYRPYHDPSEDEIASMVEERRRKLIAKSRARGRFEYYFPHEEQAIEDYLPGFRKWLLAKSRFDSVIASVFAVRLVMVNTGLSPANDVVAEVDFPAGFEILTDENYPQCPPEPAPPSVGALRAPVWPEANWIWHTFNLPEPTSEWDVIKPNRGRFSLDKLIHNLPEDLAPLVVRIPSCDVDTTFGIGYRLHAGNLPEPVSGMWTLHVELQEPAGA